MRFGKYTFKHGDRFTAKINDKYVEGKISLEGPYAPYLCQDVASGAKADDLLGYKYSWSIGNGLVINNVTNFKHISVLDDYDIW